MQAVINAAVVPYNMHFTDQDCLKTMHALGISPANLESGCLVGIDYEGSDQELQQAQTIIDQYSGSHRSVKPIPEETAELEWEEKFKAMKLKRGGPSVLGAKYGCPSMICLIPV